MDRLVGESGAEGPPALVPLAGELRALLYSGALLVLYGVGAAVREGFDRLGPAALLAALGAGSAACLGYCFRAGRPFEPGRVEPPNVAFDYVLFLGVGLAGIFAAYLEWKFRALGDWRDAYLFLAGLACLGLAYRFDNRLALGAGVANLAGWAGARLWRWDASALDSRAASFALGAALVGLAEASRRSGVKAHFEGTYLRFGVHLCLLSLLYGVGRPGGLDLWLLLAACGALAARSARRRTFEAFACAVVYAYAGTMRVALPLVGFGHGVLRTLMLTSAFAIAVLLWARRRFREAA